MLITLIEQIAAMRPRCVRIVADAGWGKTAFARTYANAVAERSAIIECRSVTSERDFNSAIAAALCEIGIEANPDNVGAAWAAPAEPATIVLDSARVLIGAGHAIDCLRTLLRTMPANRTIVMCSRTELPLTWSSYFQPHEIATIGSDQLAIDAAELEILFGDIEHTPALAEQILSMSRGWPIAVLLFVRLASLGKMDQTLLELGDAASFGDLHEYVQAEIFAALTEDELDTLCIVAGFGEITAKDATIALGRDAEPNLTTLSGRMRYLLTRERDIYRVVPLALAATEKMQRARVRTLMLAASEHFVVENRFVVAAEAALRGGHVARARGHLDRAGEPVARFVPSARYLATAIALSADELARSRNVLTILLGSQIPAAITAELEAKINARWETLDKNDPDTALRTTLRIARAMLLQFSGRFDEAEKSALGAERDLAIYEPDAPIVAALFVAKSLLAVNRMQLEAAEAYWQRSGQSRNPVDAYFILERNSIDLIIGAARGTSTAMVDSFAAAAEALRQATGEAHEAQAQVYEAGAHLFRHGRFPEPKILEARTAGTRFTLDPLPASEHVESPTANRSRLNILVVVDAALRQTDRTVAQDLVRAGIAFADNAGITYYQVLARVVATVFSPEERISLLDDALAVPTSTAFVARIAEVRAGKIGEDSIFAPFIKDLVSAGDLSDGATVRLEIMRGIVTAHGEDLRLRPRELELIVSLALAGSPMTRETIVDRMWPEQDESVATGSLRSTLHRLRQQLGNADLIVRDGNRYRLSSAISVDVSEAESLYNALRRTGKDIVASERRLVEHHFGALSHGIPDVYARWPWYASIETRLGELRHGLGMMLARDDFAKKNYAAAARWTERLIELDPLDEGAAVLLFLALAQSGGKAEAARWLRRYRQVLATEYSLEPSYELEKLAEEPGPVQAIA